MNKTALRFTYGDRICRKNDRRITTVAQIGTEAYYFAEGGFALIEDQDCYDVVEKSSGYFQVSGTLDDAPLGEYLQHGYEERQFFVDALRKLINRWSGRIGKNIGDRNGFLLLRFYDTPGGNPEEAWLPLYLLKPTSVPEWAPSERKPSDDILEELDRAIGFD